MRILCPVILIAVLLFKNLPVIAQVHLNEERIVSELSLMKDKLKVRSVIAGVWKGDTEIALTAIGESMTDIPASADMHLRIGGVSETFLGTLLMLLVEDGIISLDDKISKWMPELYESDKATVGMLMKNTAGYKDYVENEDFVNLVLREPFRYTRRSEIYDFAHVTKENNFTPGTDQKYSHTEFTILGDIIERASGKSMKDLYVEKVFRPSELSSTGYSTTSEIPSPVLHAFSSDRGIYEDATYWNPSWTGESGPLYSTLSDLGKWARIFGTGKLLRPESFAQLISRPEGAKRDDLYFASGFVVADGWFLQNPNFNGYSGAFGYYAPAEITVIVYTTQSEEVKSGGQAFQIFKELVKMITPGATINF